MKKPTTKITILIALILILNAFPIVNAETFTQYTPSPVGTTISKIWVLNDGTGFGYTTGGSFIKYDGSTWTAIAVPNASTLENYTTLLFSDKISDRIILAYQHVSLNDQLRIISYTPSTNTYSIINTIDTNSTFTTDYFECSQEQDKCYIGGINRFQIYPTQDLSVMPTSPVSARLINFNTGFYYSDIGTTPRTYYSYDGFSSTSIFALNTASGSINGVIENSATNKMLCASGSGISIAFFNTTSNTYQTGLTTNDCLIGANDGNTVYIVNSASNITECSLSSKTCSLNTLTSQNMNYIDFDETTGTGVAGGVNGVIYMIFGTPTTSTYSTTINLNPNPTIYGSNTFIGATPFHDDGFSAEVFIDIYNSTGSNIYGTQCSVPNSITCSTTINGISWTFGFQPNQNYSVVVQTNWSNGDNEITNQTLIVIQNATTSNTNYQLTGNNYSNPSLTNLVAVSRSSNNYGYFTANNGTNIIIASADSNNINNLQIKTKQLTGIGGADYPTSLEQYIGTILLGTNDELFQFTDATTNNANNLIQDSDSNGFLIGADFIQSITMTDNNTAWVCRKGTTTDDGNLFNLTDDDFSDTISQDPCISILYNNGLIYIHSGNSGIKIYNATTQTLITTITTTSSPSNENNDWISIFNNKLAIVSGTNRARIYDITNPSLPTLQKTCILSSAEIRSIELLNDNQLIIGTTTNQLRICDTNNNQTFDNSLSGYLTTNLKTYTNSEIPYEIERLNNNGKFHVAEGNTYSVYQFTSETTETTTNNAPIINEIYTPVTSVCYNEILNVETLATDPDNDDLTYDYTCEGIKLSMTNNFLTNKFSCSYTTGTTKTIKVFVNDGTTTITQTKNIAVSDCTPSDKIELKILDGITTNALSGVTVTITGQGTKTSDQAGIVLYSNLTSQTQYTITISKAGYFSKSVTGTTSPYQQIVYLEPTTTNTGQQITTLLVTVKNSSNSPISNALVSVTEPITAQSKYAFTDANGIATITNMFSTSRGIISAGKTGEYDVKQEYFTLSNGEQKTITLTLEKAGKTYITDRGCEDYVEGIYLCSPLRIDNTGDSCTADNECLTGRCMPSSSNNRKCSNFNWTQCDSAGMERGNRCVTRFTANAGAVSFTGFALDNFLYVLIFIVIFIMVIMVMSATKKR
jgi:hypothetical protein